MLNTPGVTTWAKRDAFRYRFGMTIQIAVRLPDELVGFLDEQVASGNATSRAAFVATALEREMRRVVAQHDASILRSVGVEDDLDDLVAWSVDRVLAYDLDLPLES